MPRRTFLKGAGVTLALPWLDAMGVRVGAAPAPELPGRAVGRATRFPSLTLGIKRGTGFGGFQDHTLSWTPAGTPIPAENRPHVLFDQLFRPDTPQTIRQREEEFVRRTSVLDSLREQA